MIRKNVCKNVIMTLLLMMQSAYSVNPPPNTVVGCVSEGAYTDYCGFNTPAAIAITGTTAYVVNTGNSISDLGSVSIVDTTNNSVIGCVTNDIPPTSSGGFNFPVAIAITGTKAYVANTGNNSISVIDLTTNTVTGYVLHYNYPDCAISTPAAIAINGSTAYVCNRTGGSGQGSVSVIHVASNTIIDCVDDTYCPFDAPSAIAIRGTTAYVCNANTVSVIDLVNNKVTQCVSEGAYAYYCGLDGANAIAITGATAYVCTEGASVSVIDLDSNTIIGCVTNDNPACGFSFPSAIAITPDGTTAYVSNYSGNTVTIIDLMNNTIIGCVAPTDYPGCGFNQPNAIAITSSGTTAYVSNRLGNSVSVIEYAPLPPAPAPTNGTGCIGNFTGDIELSWHAPASGQPLGYAIFDNSLLSGEPIATTASNVFTATIASPTTNTYYVVAFYADGALSSALVITASNYCHIPPHPSNFPPATVNGCKMKNKFLLQTDYINKITWTPPASGPAPAAYRVYQDNNVIITPSSNPEEILSTALLLATIPANAPLQYYHHDTNPSVVYTYFIVPIDSAGEITGYNSIIVTDWC